MNIRGIGGGWWSASLRARRTMSFADSFDFQDWTRVGTRNQPCPVSPVFQPASRADLKVGVTVPCHGEADEALRLTQEIRVATSAATFLKKGQR